MLFCVPVEGISLADPVVVGGGGGSGGSNCSPPLKNNVKGFNPKVQIYFLRVVLNLQEKHYIFTKTKFFPGEHPPPPDPLSYDMSDVNPHLSLM